MMLERWSPFRSLSREFGGFQDEMNRLFEGFGRRMLPVLGSEKGAWAPAMDVYEDEGNFVVKTELPGLSKDDIEVSVEERTLTIQGERKMEKDVKEENYHRIERGYGRFFRSLTLPSNVDTKKLKATFKEGILELVLPKTEDGKRKKINVKLE